MSFSSRVKAELAALPLDKRCCVTAELGAFILGASVMTLKGAGKISLSFRTERAVVLKRALKLFNASGTASARPRLTLQERLAGRREYHLVLQDADSHRLLRDQGMLRADEDGVERFAAPQRVMRRNCCRRSYLRGAFLACGYIADPKRRYQVEWVYHDATRALRLKRVLSQTGLSASLSERRGSALLSLTGGDQVSELLKLMGASVSVFNMENLRAEKSLRERANRAFNCDQANLSRQLSASGRQIEALEKLSRLKGLSSLPQNLEQLARLRLSRQDAKLAELGECLNPPLTKSGVAHQMRKLMALADELDDPDHA
ncbi:MAG: DNA-binding protein WhiA [Bacillota bacterium]|nr:DNA-binding protein WhiA [Bacillota bacterium]